ncbi:hypothetical protein HDU76_001985, partial [Blyttiomyces sp. JEL0837]
MSSTTTSTLTNPTPSTIKTQQQQQQPKKASDVDSHGHPRLPFRGHHTRETADARRKWVESFTGTQLNEIGNWWSDEGKEGSFSVDKLKSNIEMPIGLIKIPLAAAGPLKFNGKETNGYILCPMATTEGALLASVTRGATALNQAGGVQVESTRQRMVRAPFWTMETEDQVPRLQQFIDETIGIDRLRQVVGVYSSHAKLIALEYVPVGKTLHVRFVYETGDAAGQNMTTTTTWE